MVQAERNECDSGLHTQILAIIKQLLVSPWHRQEVYNCRRLKNREPRFAVRAQCVSDFPSSHSKGNVYMDHTKRSDLIISNARLLDGSVTDVAIHDGRFVDSAIATESEPVERIDAEGRLVTPVFVNGHMHLEKVYTLSMLGETGIKAYASGSMGAAMTSIELASEVKKHYDRSWIEPNVRRALIEAVRYGVLNIQAFVDVDTTAKLEGLRAVLAVRDEFKDVLDIQIVAFPQDGLLRDAGAAKLCEEALDLGADVVGGIPWIEHTDADALEHIKWACTQAKERGLRVAMLVDDAGDPLLRTTEMLAEQMIAHDLIGHGTACHARAVGTYEMPSVLRLARLASEAGMGFISDPHTGPLHLPVEELIAEGLNVGLGQDDIEDAYYPWGRHNMLEVAFLSAHILGFRSESQQRTLIEMITERAAAALGIEDYGIREGAAADFCIHPHKRISDLLTQHEAPYRVYRKGLLVAETTPATTTFPFTQTA